MGIPIGLRSSRPFVSYQLIRSVHDFRLEEADEH